MSNVGNVTLISPSSTTSTTGSATTALTQADFLQLMVAQFQSQDPLADDSGSGGGSGSSTSDYVNQLMSMTNLTTMQNMSTQQGVQLAQQLPGATVSVTDASGNTVTGVVQNTTVTTGGVNVTINGVTYPASDIVGIQPTATTATSGTTSN
jgi:flagellar basal-body rod modification protein FlgD